MSGSSFSFPRKAHSATKIGEIDKILSCDFNSNIRLPCASASYASNRNKIHSSIHLKKLLSDEAQEPFNRADSNKNRLFLYASQILEKLKRISREHDSKKLICVENNEEHNGNHHVKKLKLSFKKVNFYYDFLKRLLEERCIFLLKEESRSCFKHTHKLVSDLKLLFTNEIIKLTTMPVKSYNRFIDSSGISISILEQLFKKVNYICDLHSSLKNTYQNIINFFHVSFDMELNQTLIKINRFQNSLYSETVYWTHKILEIFILKLCLADPDSISPEFLRHVLEICESFNLLFFDKRHVNYLYLSNTYNSFFNSFIHSDYEAILLDFILQYLSHFEAKVAAEKITQYIFHECKNNRTTTVKEDGNERNKNDISSSKTSDYYSASPTIAEENPHLEHNLKNSTYSFENILLSFIQRNQSLVLKYLYSIICLDVSVPCISKNDITENNSDLPAVNKVWNLPQIGFKNKNYLSLEERYWTSFWKKVLSFSLKLVLEVPCHQYGNAASGIFLLWPHSYHHVIFQLLKSSAQCKDISPSGLNVMKSLLHHLLVHTIQDSWDKNMSSALAMIHNQSCMPIPVAENRARTRAGNALCLCLECFGANFFNDSIITGNLFFQMFYAVQVTLDCFIFFTNIKSRASISSADISTYLLISRSDCMYALKLLEGNNSFGIATQSLYLNFFSPSSTWKACISSQIEIISGHMSEVLFVMHRVISSIIRDIYWCKIKRNYWGILCYHSSFQEEIFSLSTIDEVLNSFTGVIHHIYDGITILSVIISATATTLLSVLQGMQNNISHKKIQVIKEIVFHFLKWIDVISIDEYEREKLKEITSLKKLLCIIQILESSLKKPRYFSRTNNRVSPLLTDVNPEECRILTEEEQLYWRTNCNRNLFPCS